MDYSTESHKTLNRILHDIDLTTLKKSQQIELKARLDEHFPRLFEALHQVYGWQYDFYFHVQTLVKSLTSNYSSRPTHLHRKDKQRTSNKLWYKNEDMLGMAVYVDLFGGDLKKLKARIPYLTSLGITYLHLMPLYDCPDGDSDGGYAVSDYRKVMKNLGNIDDLKALAKALDKNGINLVLDFVFNHTSDEHEWATKAKNGDATCQSYYYMFDDKMIPNEYEANLREIFPQVRRGNFTFNPESAKWVWTTFNNFQWDLNYSNPEVFNKVTEEMLFLANIGCDALRLDALAFIWKEKGTSCENQDKAHTLIQAFNACLQIAAPSVVFKSEAIVHPDEVIKYIDPQECQLSYNPLLMALIWNSLATRKTNLITASLQKTGTINPDCSWVNYVRCHDDIGWTFDDAVANDLGINGDDHRRFLNQFYTGKFAGSFANGVPFGENPTNGDCRVCGSLASLCGLESALETNNTVAIHDAIKRILLVHSVILSFGGIPLLYAGDEFALLNDYSYTDDPSKKHDARWVHRIAVDNALLEEGPSGDAAIASQALTRLVQVRKQHEILGKARTHVLDAPNQHCFLYLREDDAGAKCLCVVNFSEHHLTLPASTFDALNKKTAKDLVSEITINAKQELKIAPYQFLWLL